MNASRIQHTIPATVVLAIAATVTYISFTQEPAGAFLFPRLISIFFVGLAIWNFIRAALGMARVGGGLDFQTIKNILPGLIVMIIYIFFAAKNLGFYLSSWLTFMTLFTLYDPAAFSNSKAWAKRLIITTVFMIVIYLLFTSLLQVQTPRGILF